MMKVISFGEIDSGDVISGRNIVSVCTEIKLHNDLVFQ